MLRNFFKDLLGTGYQGYGFTFTPTVWIILFIGIILSYFWAIGFRFTDIFWEPALGPALIGVGFGMAVPTR
jgi:hypothetical protein